MVDSGPINCGNCISTRELELSPLKIAVTPFVGTCAPLMDSSHLSQLVHSILYKKRVVHSIKDN